MTKRHAEPGVVIEEPKKLDAGLSLFERRDFVKLCEQTALPWQIQVGLVTSIAKGEIHSLDQMIRFIEGALAKDGEEMESQKVVDQRATMLKIWSIPEMESLTVKQWELYMKSFPLWHMYPFWSAERLDEAKGWQQSWYRFFGLPSSLP